MEDFTLPKSSKKSGPDVLTVVLLSVILTKIDIAVLVEKLCEVEIGEETLRSFPTLELVKEKVKTESESLATESLEDVVNVIHSSFLFLNHHRLAIQTGYLFYHETFEE